MANNANIGTIPYADILLMPIFTTNLIFAIHFNENIGIIQKFESYTTYLCKIQSVLFQKIEIFYRVNTK